MAAASRTSENVLPTEILNCVRKLAVIGQMPEHKGTSGSWPAGQILWSGERLAGELAKEA